jgi:hypothetical protein
VVHPQMTQMDTAFGMLKCSRARAINHQRSTINQHSEFTWLRPDLGQAVVHPQMTQIFEC